MGLDILPHGFHVCDNHCGTDIHVLQPFEKSIYGAVKGEALVGNTLMGFIGFFLVIAALILAFEGVKAIMRYRSVKAQAAPAKA